MRKSLLLLPVLALVATPLASAEAASSYKVSATVSVKLVDLSSSSSSARKTTIKGRVSGSSSLKGKKVSIYGVNSDTAAAERFKIGTATLSSSGRFAKSYRPSDGGRIRIEVVKSADSKHGEGSDGTYVDAFQFVPLEQFDYSGSDPGVAQVIDPGHTPSAHIDGKYFRTEIYIPGGATAIFNTQGFRCKKSSFKIGVADGSESAKGHYRLRQGDHNIKSGDLDRGDAAYDAIKSSSVRNDYSSSKPLEVKAYSGDEGFGADFIFGNPKVFCTYPTDSTPKGVAF